MSRRGADLALLLLAGFRTIADQGAEELSKLGFDDVRPVHDFALHSVLAGANSASELGRAMSITKQAAAKTVALLEARGYLARDPDPADKRRVTLRVTERGMLMMREGEAIFDRLRTRWEEQAGADAVAALEVTLQRYVGANGVGCPGSRRLKSARRTRIALSPRPAPPAAPSPRTPAPRRRPSSGGSEAGRAPAARCGRCRPGASPSRHPPNVRG
jgi:DNA-binding MarR family transcriptional regulator